MKKLEFLAYIFGLSLALSFTLPAFGENHVEIPKTDRDCAKLDSCFVPIILSIKKGQNAVWQNNDLTIHSLVGGSKDAGKLTSFKSGTLFPGETFSFVATNTGIFPYFCEIHPWMKGVIWVT